MSIEWFVHWWKLNQRILFQQITSSLISEWNHRILFNQLMSSTVCKWGQTKISLHFLFDRMWILALYPLAFGRRMRQLNPVWSTGVVCSRRWTQCCLDYTVNSFCIQCTIFVCLVCTGHFVVVRCMTQCCPVWKSNLFAIIPSLVWRIDFVSFRWMKLLNLVWPTCFAIHCYPVSVKLFVMHCCPAAKYCSNSLVSITFVVIRDCLVSIAFVVINCCLVFPKCHVFDVNFDRKCKKRHRIELTDYIETFCFDNATIFGCLLMTMQLPHFRNISNECNNFGNEW